MMMTLMIAAAAAATQPAAPAPAVPQATHDIHMQMGPDADHKGMDCCKDCCKDMTDKHEGHAEHDRRTGE